MTIALLQYLARHVRGRSSLRFRMSIAGILFCVLSSTATAQDFVNSGPVNNTGTLRLKNGASGIPSSLTGTFELFGANQTLPASQYNNVTLTGSGTKTTSGGNLSILGNLTIASPVSLTIAKGAVLTLGDTLFESGSMTGAIQKSVDLSGGTTSSSFGNIGASISWSGTAPGVTTVLRVSDSVVTGNGNQSIKRIYSISPTSGSATGTVSLKYDSTDLNGNNPALLELWNSTDNGTTWSYEGGTVDTTAMTLTQTNASLGGLWTASDTLHRLGSTAKSNPPASIALASGNNQTKQILNPLDNAFTVTVLDINGNPVSGILVQFSVTSPDTTAYGDSLSVSSAVTDASGHASTLLTLGSKVGTYTVAASYGALTPVQFFATALPGPATSIAQSLGNAQIKSITTKLDTAFTVTVNDVGGNAVNGATVAFSIVSKPLNASGQSLTVTSTTTDASGHASTFLTLGDKVGMYQVRADINGGTDSVIFTATAKSGLPAAMIASSAVIDSAENGTTLSNPIKVSVVDAGNNPVQGEVVTFTLSSPDSSAQGSLSNTSVTTNSSGQASTILTLGTRTGNYIVQVRSATLGSGGALVFTAKALPGPVTVARVSSGNYQSAQIKTALADYVVNVYDQNGNPVPNTAVTFSINTVPSNAVGAALSVTSTNTNSAGSASTRLTLGNKVGVYRVKATANGIDTFFTSTAQPGPAIAMSPVSGSGQSGVILTTLPTTLTVHLVDAGGNNTPNTAVRFFVSQYPDSAASYQLRDSVVATDSLGLARTTFRLGNKVGVYKVTAKSTGLPDTTFVMTANPGIAIAMKSISGTNQTDSITATLKPFVVRVADIGGNGVPGSTVRFMLSQPPAGSIGTALSDTAMVSDSSGNAATILTLGSKVGTYTVTALISTPAPSQVMNRKSKILGITDTKDAAVTFTVTARPGSVSLFTQVLGNDQRRPTGTTLDTAFIAHVRDRGGNAVPGSPVRFDITSAPASAVGQRVRDTVVTSDSLGVASTLFTLGDREGTYAVTATIPTLPSLLFTSKGYYVYGDPNNDVNVDIADITAVIDHINNKISFSVPDSIKSDLNHDDRIDTSDVATLRDSILMRPLTFDSTITPVITAKLAKNSGVSGVARVSVDPGYFEGASSQLEVTSQGLRLNLTNTVPVKGVELRIKLNDTVMVSDINYVFARAEKMITITHTQKNEIVVLAYSLLNDEIQPGDGSILRLPNITSVDQIDTSKVVLSVQGNVAVKSRVTKISAPPEKYPATFTLSQNYPNPFNNATVLQYTVPDVKTSETKVVIQIFNVLGQKVKTLVYGEHDPGTYKVTWDGTNQYGARVASGVYFYRMLARNLAITKKMLYVK